MASQTFGPSVTTSSGSALTLYYDNIEVSGDGASARITNPRAQFTYKSGWSDSSNSFSTIGTNAVAGASHGAQSLSGGATKTFYATPNWVALSYNGETTVQYTFRVSNVSFFTGDSSTRDYTMNINLPRRVSTVGSVNSISTFNMGATVPISWTRPDTNSTVTVRVEFVGWTTTLANRTTNTSTNWASSLATLAAKVPNATSGTGTVYADYFDINGNFVGTVSRQFTANVPSSVVPSAGTLTVAEGNAAVLTAFGTATNTFIQDKSQIKGTAGTGGAGLHGSTITKTELLINGSVAATFSGHGAGATATTPVITYGSDVSIVKRVTDSRGRTALSTPAITGTIRPYSAPSIASLEAFRSTSGGAPSGSSTQVTVQLGASVSSLLNGSTQKNTLKYVVKYKLSTGSTYTTEFTSALPAGTLTTSPTGNGRRIIPATVVFNAGSVYDIQVEVTDVFGGTPQNKNAVISTEIVPLSISDVGIGVGKVWQQGSIDAKSDIFTEGGFYSSNVLIPSSADLNNYVDTAVYVQNSDAAAVAGSNYPEPLAGFLEVSSNLARDWVLQRYTTYNTYKTYVRKLYQGTWHEWKLVGEPIVAGSGGVQSSDMLFKPASAGGSVGIRFDSNVNPSSDYGEIRWHDDANTYALWGNSNENGALILSVGNDPANSSSDVIALEAPAGIFLNSPNIYQGTGNRIHHRGNLQIDRGVVGLNSSSWVSKGFGFSFGGIPTVVLTAHTTNSGSLVGKVRNVTTTGFEATIGGTGAASDFNYIAIWGG